MMPSLAPNNDRPHGGAPCLGREALLSLLNQLLEGERAGARAVGEMCAGVMPADTRAALRAIALDEARYCAMLTRQIRRLGGKPSRKTGAFYDKLQAEASHSARLALLDRGQGWVVRKLHEALPGILDRSLHADLKEMLETHQRNIERCGEIRR